MFDNKRILAQNELISNSTWTTGINNNDLIIGPSGAGKTRSYVQPNILQCNESMLIADTKGSLKGTFAPLLRRHRVSRPMRRHYPRGRGVCSGT